MSLLKFSGLRGSDRVLGGDLVDLGTPFASRDKVAHLVLGALTFAAFDARNWFGPLVTFGIVLGLAVLNEVIEAVRLALGKQGVLVDTPDGTDLLVTMAGAVLGWLVL